MKITPLSPSSLSAYQTDVLAIGIFIKEEKGATDEEIHLLAPTVLQECDKALGIEIIKVARERGFGGKIGEHFSCFTWGKIPTQVIVLIGFGNCEELTTQVYRKAAGLAYQFANEQRFETLALAFPVEKEGSTSAWVAITEGLHLAAYNFDKYLTEKKTQSYLKAVHVFCDPKSSLEVKAQIKKGEAISRGVLLARDLINEGPLTLTPDAFARRAEEESAACDLKVHILNEKELEKENFGLLLAVARASLNVTPPRLVRITYRPKQKAKKHFALIGKGITFDSGGLDLKSPEAMLSMKSDMSGAACVLGTMIALAHLKPHVAVTGYLVCVENAIGPHACHPGNVVISRKGLSVEINDTDAEGRLILADALHYAQQIDNPDVIIDIATLTGACAIALGPKTAGVFANQEILSEKIVDCGKAAGENFWPLPLDDELFEQLQSNIADLKNRGERYGGAITAALFLKKFINPGSTWAHLDIAGPAFCDKASILQPKGGSGFGVRTLVRLITESTT